MDDVMAILQILIFSPLKYTTTGTVMVLSGSDVF